MLTKLLLLSEISSFYLLIFYLYSQFHIRFRAFSRPGVDFHVTTEGREAGKGRGWG
jgi:hypothetical protein